MTNYYVKALWDDEASLYYSETNVPGLNIEAETLHDFIAIAEELTPQMLEANVPGYSPDKLRGRATAALELAVV
jgi:hypothetical protein